MTATINLFDKHLFQKLTMQWVFLCGLVNSAKFWIFSYKTNKSHSNLYTQPPTLNHLIIPRLLSTLRQDTIIKWGQNKIIISIYVYILIFDALIIWWLGALYAKVCVWEGTDSAMHNYTKPHFYIVDSQNRVWYATRRRGRLL